jgi:phage terminase small subunit
VPALANTRHERFAQELAKGKTATEAYVEAGYKPNDGNAATLKGNQRVAERVAELMERAAFRCEVTVAAITQKLLAIAEKAETSKDAPLLSVARASYMDAAKLNGLIVDKVNMDAVVRDEREMSDAELAHIASAGSIGAASPSESTH